MKRKTISYKIKQMKRRGTDGKKKLRVFQREPYATTSLSSTRRATTGQNWETDENILLVHFSYFTDARTVPRRYSSALS